MSEAGSGANPRLQPTLRLVIALNLAFFVIEFFVAEAIGAVSLLADSVDFRRGRGAERFGAHRPAAFGRWCERELVSHLAAILLLPAIAFLVTLIHKLPGLGRRRPRSPPLR